jgi:NAD(P)-dependent dehydrogenase (short-subunit alcohol dehydrogenase family)
MLRKILVTGGNSGIGLEMVKAFVEAGHEVVIAARDTGKSQAAINDIKAAQPNAVIYAIALDLANFDSIDAAAAQTLALLPALDTVMVNAGSYTQGLRIAFGLESMVATMHFGHFRLMQQLLPTLAKAADARVVVTSSVAHWAGTIDLDKFNNPKKYLNGFQAYGSAKLANLIYARELARRVADTNIRVNAFHPGGVATGIWRELPGPIQSVVDRVLISSAKGADTAIWLATTDAGKTHHGQYFVRRRKAATKAISKNEKVADLLWRFSEDVAGI